MITRLCACLIVWCGSVALAVEDSQPVSDASAPAAPGSAVDSGISVEQLLKQLPSSATVVQRDEQVFWDDGKGHSFRFAPVIFSDRPVIETSIGRIAVMRKLIDEGRFDAIATLPALIARAQGAGIQGSDLVLSEGMMTGIHLRSAGVIVLDEGVLKKVDLPPSDRTSQRQRIADAVAVLIKALPGTGLDDLGRRTVVDMLQRMADDKNPSDLDEVTPGFARRVARFRWVEGVFGSTHAEAAAELVSAIADAERFLPTVSYEDVSEARALRLAEVHDAFGNGGWALSTPTRSAFTRAHTQPMYYPQLPEMSVVVDLPAGADPCVSPQSITGARLFHGGHLLASWKPETGFQADLEAWRKVVTTHGKGIGKNAVTDFLPPHLVIAGLDGDIDRVVTAGGELKPPRNGSAVEAERFLIDCAKTLPDAAHLDLVGEYLFAYVYDSPDSRHPFLIGNKRDKGDIHQTSVQTISAVTGGMMRGDCDDLAELYQAIAERQGRTAHVISLPAHAACCWAEKQDDGAWHVFILQTGPAVEFADRTLADALAKSYKSFDDSETFDPNGLSLSLRFSEENTRSHWRLSWRIFAEPEYARVMIDVQKDWHFQTYQRGIAKMLRRIAEGDDDNANFRELSGLYTSTGQYDLAAEHHRRAIEQTRDPLSRLYENIELVGQLFQGKHDSEARALAKDIIEKQIPEHRDKLGVSVVQVGAELCGVLRDHANDLTVKTIRTCMLGFMSTRIVHIGNWLNSPEFNQEAWEMSSEFQKWRRLTQLFAATGIAALEEAGQDALPLDDTLQGVAKSVQEWLNNIAFRDLDEPDEAMMRYASAGAYYAAILGQERFTALLEKAEVPKSGEHDHLQRIGGLAQLNLDLPWIRISVPFWSERITELFERHRETLDRQEVARMGRHIETAYAVGTKLGIEHPIIDHQYHLARLIVALVAQDADVVRERLHLVAEKDDKRLRDASAQWLGDAARFLPLDWYKQVLGIWKDELNYKPKYFLIAWRAALNHAPRHALMVGEMAATEFKDDPAFIEEYDFMKTVLEQPAKDAAAKEKAETR
ncbi:MAG: hypothetical protein H0V44_01090 [Planctomycetes bacterium]|nr:hypothetical protein [Planctomycetota bacterium]